MRKVKALELMLARLRAPHLYSATHCSTLSPLQLYELHRRPQGKIAHTGDFSVFICIYEKKCSNFDHLPHRWGPFEFTFALTCKQQSFARKQQIIQAYLIFWGQNLAYLNFL